MPTTILQPRTKKNRKTAVSATGQSIQLFTEKKHRPEAGWGACKVSGCTCKQYVPAKRNTDFAPTGHLPNPCETCGHDVRYHA